jgi:hypothetical protein
MNQFQEDLEIFLKILWIVKAAFNLSSDINRHNYVYWNMQNPAAKFNWSMHLSRLCFFHFGGPPLLSGHEYCCWWVTLQNCIARDLQMHFDNFSELCHYRDMAPCLQFIIM